MNAIRGHPTRPNPYVRDIGAKIFPGTPVMVKSGMNATTIMVVAKKIGRPTSLAARITCIGTVKPCARLSEI